MRYGMFLVSILLITTSASAAEPAPTTNAALKYWQAFANLNFDKEQEKILETWSKAPLDAAADKLLDNSSVMLRQMHRGAQLNDCNWGLDFEDGPGMILPHLGKARTLTRVAALSARREFARKNSGAAIDVALDAFTMARHCNTDFTLISTLVRYADEITIFEALAPHLPSLDAKQLERLAAALDAPLGGYTISDSIVAEKRYMAEWLIRKLKEAEANKSGTYREVLESLIGPAESKEVAAANERLMKTVDSFAKAIKLTEDLLPMYDELARLYSLPAKEFDVKYPPFDKEAKGGNAMAALLLPAINNVAAAQRRNQTQRALFRAAIDIVHGGSEKAKATKDPFGDGPFYYRAFEGGFELKSKFQFKGNPVTLTVGQANPGR
jgi:hypothetical protein